ncbi:MAG: glycosyltransferase [Thaumarchaeota archaeon]|nr:glycosyltransferase [Nitrososphaerota archaeon]
MKSLKILHINDGDLDDSRVINAAKTGKKAGYEEYFCGENLGQTFNTDVFTKLTWIKIPDRARIAKSLFRGIDRFWKWYPYPEHALSLERQLKNVVEEIKPDIIHAHNIFVAYPASKFGIPMVLDDHELYSLHIKAQNEKANLRKKLITKVKENLWADWEQKIGEKYPIITVSTQIANHHKKYCNNVYVVPNYPTENAIRFDSYQESVKENLRSAYLGRDSDQNFSMVRNITGLHQLFSTKENIGTLLRIGVSQPNTSRIKSVGTLRMDEAYEVLNRDAHIGLLPWQKHWFHEYCNPNKVYEYAHCGLWLIVIDDLKPVIDDFGIHCDKFSNYDDLADLLAYYNDNPSELNRKRSLSLEHAQNNMVWEKSEQKILEAYKKA